MLKRWQVTTCFSSPPTCEGGPGYAEASSLWNMDVGTQKYAFTPSATCFVSTWLTDTAPGDLGILQPRARKAVKYRTRSCCGGFFV